MPSTSLPAMHPDQTAISRPLQQAIATSIQENGPMDFADFMNAALYTPTLGYYRNALPVFGAAGDFITAPTISPLYGHCIAKQCMQWLSLMEQGCIVEYGAGGGELAEAILSYFESHQVPLKHYCILEVSGALKAEQQARLLHAHPERADTLIWLDQLPSEPWQGVILANEVMDAFPVQRFQCAKGDTLEQAFVTLQDDAFAWQWQQAEPGLEKAYRALGLDLPPGYQSEINTWLSPWIASLAHSLKQGACLLIDYGFDRDQYYCPSRHAGTLMCHFQHHAHTNPLTHVGVQDITAHVDFTAVAYAATAAGMTIDGYTTQGHFLLNCGLLDELHATHEKATLMQNQAVKKLTLPHEMGELFKVMALTKNLHCDPIGFQHHDQTHRL